MRGNSWIILVVILGIVVLVLLVINRSSATNPVPGLTNYNSTPTTSTSQELANEVMLEITSPKNGDHLTSAKVVVKGKTVPNSDVFINDTQTTSNTLGNFSLTITLDPGENTISVSTNDESGNYSEKEVVVTLDQ